MIESVISHLDLVDKVVGTFATLITGIGGLAIRYHRGALARERAKGDMRDADIAFLYAVEAQYRQEEKQRTGHDPRNRVREIVKDQGLTWSGLFTPGRVANRNAARGLRVAARRIAANMREAE